MIGRVNTGGGGTGATLTVTAPSGCTVTVTKDGKTKTKVADSFGLAVFKGLASGEWTISITDGEQTAQKTVTITADYSTAITFFAATIHVTYPEGSVCTATDGVTTLTAPDTSGTWDCVVPNAAVWTVTVVETGLSESVEIAENGQTESVKLDRLYFVKDGAITEAFTFDNYSLEYSLRGGYVVFQTKHGTKGNGVAFWGAGSNAADLSAYTKLCVDAEATSTRGEKQDLILFGTTNIKTGGSYVDKFTASVSSDRFGNGYNIKRRIFNVDISSVSSGFLAVFIGDLTKTVTLKIYNAWVA